MVKEVYIFLSDFKEDFWERRVLVLQNKLSSKEQQKSQWTGRRTAPLQGTELSPSLDVQNKRRYKSLQLPG